MRSSLRWRIALPYVLLLVVVLGGLTFYIDRVIRNLVLDNLRANLVAEADLLGDTVAPFVMQPDGGEQLDALARKWAPRLGVRVTVIRPDGSVAADSHEAARAMENHANRPEVRQALTGQPGDSIRFSETLGLDMLYVAVPLDLQGLPPGALRLAVSVNQVNARLAEIQRTIILVAALTTALAVLLAIFIAQRTTRPITALTRMAQGIGAGHFTSLSFSPRRDEVGQLSQAFGQMADRLAAQMASFKAEQEKLSGVLTYMSDGILIVDPGGKVLLINPAAQRIFDVNETAALDQSLMSVARQHEVIDLWRRSLDSGQQQASTFESLPARLFIQAVATPLSQYAPGSTLLVFQDLTRVRRLEMVRREFVSNVSHELRTPLASLKILTETLQEGALEDPPAARRFLDRMDHEIDNLTQMVRELLELSRIESGRVPLNRESIDPAQFICETAERMRLQAERAGLTLTASCPDGLPVIFADPQRLEQVLVNLVHNAIKFTTPGGSVTLSAQKQVDQVLFSVRDTGVGIPADALERIFERFYKADRSRSGGGTGLGLSIARHLVEVHGGRIWAESEPDKGSAFFFTIPIQKGDDSG